MSNFAGLYSFKEFFLFLKFLHGFELALLWYKVVALNLLTPEI